jgi:hypothetical protein
LPARDGEKDREHGVGAADRGDQGYRADGEGAIERDIGADRADARSQRQQELLRSDRFPPANDKRDRDQRDQTEDGDKREHRRHIGLAAHAADGEIMQAPAQRRDKPEGKCNHGKAPLSSSWRLPERVTPDILFVKQILH